MVKFGTLLQGFRVKNTVYYRHCVRGNVSRSAISKGVILKAWYQKAWYQKHSSKSTLPRTLYQERFAKSTLPRTLCQERLARDTVSETLFVRIWRVHHDCLTYSRPHYAVNRYISNRYRSNRQDFGRISRFAFRIFSLSAFVRDFAMSQLSCKVRGNVRL